MKNNYNKLFTELYIYYLAEEKIITFFDTDNDYYSYIDEKEVHLPTNYMYNITEWSFFAYLHELGHIMTNTNRMKRYEQEYLATMWALEKAKELKVKVSARTIRIYQQYIFKWRETSIKLKAKNVCKKEALVIK